jgi:FkbH-like protein
MSDQSTQSAPILAVAATFTAEPVGDSLSFWMEALDLGAEVQFAAYSQVLQELLNPSSLLSTNAGGLNVVLVRLEDWMGAAGQGGADDAASRTLDELGAAVAAFAARARSPLVVCFAPASPAALADPARAGHLASLEGRFAEAARGLPGVSVMSSAEVARGLAAEAMHDPEGLALGHVPYTPAGFAVLGTALARRAHSALARPAKVIVLDCDQTLWTGVCGEDGTLGVQVDAPRVALQEFMLGQHEAGRLLCLCSKNAEADVLEVLDRHPGMRLRREHLVAWRVNWKPKSVNIRALAEELNLGLDSFVFIDDDPVQCAEVQAACPEVLVLPLPAPAEIPAFLDRVWALDRGALTAEDKKRTTLYRQEAARARLRDAAETFETFLAGLELRVDIGAVTPAQAPRVSQLTQRTNQFNTTTVRRSEREVLGLEAAGLECLTVNVADRFGDYGLVGVAIFSTAAPRLVVDSLLMSCRALGRGVEHRILAHLAERATASGCRVVEFPFAPTAKNQPALSFLGEVAGPYREETSAGLRFVIPTEVAAAARPARGEPVPAEVADEATAEPAPAARRAPATLQRIARELHDAGRVLEAVERWRQARRGPAPTGPASALDDLLCAAWARELGVARVAPEDDLPSLGAGPDEARAVARWLAEALEVELTAETVGSLPTVARLARALRERGRGRDLERMAALVAEVDRLSDEEVSTRLADRGLVTRADATEAAGSAELYRCLGFERGVAHAGAEVVLTGTGRWARLPVETAELALRCPEFGALDAHACRLARLSGGDPAAIGGRLADAARAGVLVSRSDLADRCRRALSADAASDAEAGPPITAVGIVTCDRVEALGRGLASYMDNCRAHGRAVEFVVTDDSRSPRSRAENLETLRALKRQFGARVSYAGATEKEAFVRRLVDKGGVPEDVTRFAFGYGLPAPTIGGNTNALFLHAAGEVFFEADDDTVCRIAPHPARAAGGLGLCGSRDPSDYWFFADRGAAEASAPRETRDLLALHQELLGRRVADVARDVADLHVDGADPAVVERLERGGGVVRATFNGLLGDCAWGAPFGFWRAPMGYLLMPGESHRRLVGSEASYRETCASRELVRVVPRPTLSDDTFGMSAFMGVDNRVVLPPRVPVGRGHDVIFTSMLWTCVPGSFVGHLPWTLLHAPAETRRFWPGELFRSASGFDSGKLLLACLHGWDGARAGGDERQRQRALGGHLREIGQMRLADFERYLLEQQVRLTRGFVAVAEAALDAREGEPAFWADDVRRYLDLLAQALTRPDYLTPLDLLDGRSPEDARELSRELVRQFGELLCWWPEMVDLARAWRADGHPLAVSV